MGSLGVPEIIVIFILALILFGPKKLPELGRTLGKALNEFRRASADMRMAMESELRDLERHGQEMEAKAVGPAEAPGALPDAPVGSGTIAPPAESSAATPAAVESPEVQPGEKSADGEPKPA